MKTGIALRYVLVILAIVVVWWFARAIDPTLMTLAGLLLIVGSTIWFVASIVSKPEDAGRIAKT